MKFRSVMDGRFYEWIEKGRIDLLLDLCGLGINYLYGSGRFLNLARSVTVMTILI